MRHSKKNQLKKTAGRIAAAAAAVSLLFCTAVPDELISYASAIGEIGSVIPELGPYMDNTLQCIDAYAELGPTGGYEHDGDSYVRVLPSSTLSKYEEGLLFWGSFFLFAVIPSDSDDSYVGMNFDGMRNAYDALLSAGLPVEGIFYKDFNRLIHNSSVQAKYPLIKSLASDDEKAGEYLKVMGIMGSGGSGIGGRSIPSVFSGHLSLDTRLIAGPSFTIDTGDPGFLRQVRIEYAPYDDSENFSTVPQDGWSYLISGSEVRFSNPQEDPKGVFIRFNTDGTDYQSEGGSFSTPFEAYEELLEVWCVEKCAGGKNGSVLKPSQHQRFVSLSFDVNVSSMPYAELGGTAPKRTGETGFGFTAYSHSETFTSHYNLRLFKGDSETGNPLSGASFTLYESMDGISFYDAGGITTGSDGTAEKTVEHHETFNASFCDGHPAPYFCEIPEEEADPDTGTLLNADEIEEAREANRSAALGWLDTVSDCEALSGDGHFHFIMGGVSEPVINSVAADGGDPGEIPDAGETEPADGSRAFSESGCQSARDAAYLRFIKKEYYYTFKEISARPGYTVHGKHEDDLPVEVIRTDSSEAGAVCTPTGKYADTVELDGEKPAVKTLTVPGKLSDIRNEHRVVGSEETEKSELSFGTLLRSAFSGIHPGSETPSDAVKEISGDREDTYSEETGAFQNEDTEVEISEADAFSEDVDMVEDVVEVSAFGAAADFLKNTVTRIVNLFTMESFAAVGTGPGGIFTEGYSEASYRKAGDNVKKEPSGRYSHCGNADGEGDYWRIFDHRTEGRIYMNKRDFDLSDDESGTFESYAEENGDGTLEGAVYGLFAAQDIIHPDGKTGVVYAADDLVARAATDRDGNALFSVITETPDSTYDYSSGTVIRRNNRDISLLTNLYSHAHTETDYSYGSCNREYEDLRTENGNEWQGRPLLLGEYYIKELSRSEGYELSIGKKENIITNCGQDRNAGSGGAVYSGTAAVIKKPWADVQIRGGRQLSDHPDPDDHDYNEIFFEVSSSGNGSSGFEMKLSGFPQNTKLYRLDEGTGTVKYEAGTGVYDSVTVTDENGVPVMLSAVTGYDFPVYDSEGNPETYTAYPDINVKNIRKITGSPIDAVKTEEIISAVESGMEQGETEDSLLRQFGMSDFLFVKAKTERALRANGRSTPREGSNYTDLTSGAFDNGSTADGRYGAPVVVLSIPGPLSNADLIRSILMFYDDSAYFSYGGVKSIVFDGMSYQVEIYAGTSSMSIFYTEISGVPAVFYPVRHSSDTDEMQRYVWAVYTGPLLTHLPDGIPVFGRYEITDEDPERVSAVLRTKAAAEDPYSYDLTSFAVTKTRFYPAGTCPVYGADGSILYKTEFKERKTVKTAAAARSVWTYLGTAEGPDGVFHIDTVYTDHFGALHDDSASETFEFLAVVPSDPGKHAVLNAAEAALIGEMNICGYTEGDMISVGEYFTLVKKVSVSVRSGGRQLSDLSSPDSYIVTCDLEYPGQENAIQDAGTSVSPVRVFERPVRQSVKVIKSIVYNADTDNDGQSDSFAYNTYGVSQTKKEINFRFKAYLKSSLESLCCDENGSVTWTDEEGNPMIPVISDGSVTWHRTYGETGEYSWPEIDKTTGIGINAETVSVNVPHIRTKEGTKLLETDNGILNYEKFFDAIDAANTDKWDDAAPTYSSFRPLGNHSNRSGYQVQNAKRSDKVRQFAVTWYIKEEVEALTRDVSASLTGSGFMEKEADRKRSDNSYQELLFDEALYRAILKAEKYLRPFYLYDLDAVYSIKWDSDAGGGTDGDLTTLSADRIEGEKAVNHSAYLPYGVYIVVEQQPHYVGDAERAYNDFINKWYRKDKPKEVSVPSVYDGTFSHEDIPYTMTVPEGTEDYDSTLFTGFADVDMRNTLFYTKLRISKLDSETHENILHDDAAFLLFKAERDLTTGKALCYKNDTEVTGSQSFIEGYCLKETVRRNEDGTWTGVAAEGTPVCRETDIIRFPGEEEFLSTAVRTKGKKEETGLYTVPETCITQNAGYLETPLPIGAGTYVLVETKAPSGYVRSKPAAIEVYSDKTVCSIAGNESQAVRYPEEEISEIFLENAPIRLTVEKTKESSAVSSDKNEDNTVTYRYSGRLDGTISELSGYGDMVYAYDDSGHYRGYAWKKGTLEYLVQLKDVYDNDSDPRTKVEIVYDGSLFAGYGYIKRPLLTSGDSNKFAAGADLALFEALELVRNENSEPGTSDFSFKNLIVARNANSSVKSMKADGRDILFYTFDSLSVAETKIIGGKAFVCGYDKNRNPVSLKQLTSDGHNYVKDDNEISVYGFKGSVPVFEFVGGDLTKLRYSKAGKTLSVDKDTVVYHLGADGRRDALVDPYTGMAYVEEKLPDGNVKYLGWTVEVIRDENGNILSCDKITTARPATVGENDGGHADDVLTVSKAAFPSGEASSETITSYAYPETGSVTGTWTSGGTERSHRRETVNKNIFGQNLNGEAEVTNNSGSFLKEYDPVYNSYGRIKYYQRSSRMYSSGTELYDRSGDRVRYDCSDELDEMNRASYTVHADPENDGDIYHRYGEGYVLQNTWTSSETTPNDPFSGDMSDGQADVVKRVPYGTYILEELSAPDGYLRAMPVGITVREDADMQYLKMADASSKVEISKISEADGSIIGGAELALYPAEKVYSTNYEKYPDGCYLAKTQTEPLAYKSTDWTVSEPVILTARWITSAGETIYLEGIPEGCYILEELSAPEGFVTAEPVEVEVGTSSEVLSITVCDSLTQTEIIKYCEDETPEGRKRLKGADMELYEAKTDANGIVSSDENGRPQITGSAAAAWTTSNEREWAGFAEKFREAYIAHGIKTESFEFVDDVGKVHKGKVTEVRKTDAGIAGGAESDYPTAAEITVTDEQNRVATIHVYGQRPSGGSNDFTFDFRFDLEELKSVNEYAMAYTTLSGSRRFEGLNTGVKYVAVERKAPAGYMISEPSVIEVNGGKDVRQYYIKDEASNTPEGKKVYFHKVDAVTGEELPGAHVEIRDEEGNLIDQWISSDVPHVISGQFRPGKCYRFIETISPEGYDLTGDVVFTVDDTGIPCHVYMKDESSKGTREQETTVPEETVPETSLPGETEPETLPETSSQGYTEPETFPETQTEPEEDHEHDTVPYKNESSELTYSFAVRKTDGISGEGVSGAGFVLYDCDTGTETETVRTDDDGKGVFYGLTVGKRYELKETVIPEGYSGSPESRFITVKETYKNDAVIYWIDQPVRFKKFAFLYATGDTGVSLSLLAAALLVLLIAYLIVSRKEKTHEK